LKGDTLRGHNTIFNDPTTDPTPMQWDSHHGSDTDLRRHQRRHEVVKRLVDCRFIGTHSHNVLIADIDGLYRNRIARCGRRRVRAAPNGRIKRQRWLVRIGRHVSAVPKGTR
jgi:hypothetical protein